MESISAAELYELYQSALELTDAQFQYWLSASFAVIVASYLAGDRMGNTTRWCIALAYLVGGALFFSRYMQVAGTAVISQDELVARELQLILGPLTSGPFQPLRSFFWFIGSLGTVWFVVAGFRIGAEKTSKAN